MNKCIFAIHFCYSLLGNPHVRPAFLMAPRFSHLCTFSYGKSRFGVISCAFSLFVFLRAKCHSTMWQEILKIPAQHCSQCELESGVPYSRKRKEIVTSVFSDLGDSGLAPATTCGQRQLSMAGAGCDGKFRGHLRMCACVVEHLWYIPCLKASSLNVELSKPTANFRSICEAGVYSGSKASRVRNQIGCIMKSIEHIHI